MIPAEAIEAAALVMYQNDHHGQVTDWPTTEELAKGRSIFDPPPTLDEFKADYSKNACAALEAAAPYITQAAHAAGYNEACREIIGMRPTGGPVSYAEFAANTKASVLAQSSATSGARAAANQDVA